MKPVFVPFAMPVFLVLLAVLAPMVGVFLWFTWRSKQRAVQAFVRTRLLSQLTVGVSPWRQQAKRWMTAAGAMLVLLGLARPLWGFIEQESRGSGLDIVVCFDVSRSMLAGDLKPSRLQRARMAAHDLARMAKGDRLGLVAFAGTAFLQCPLALDPEAFRQSVGALDTEIIPEAGTALAEAIREARQAFSDESGASRVIVVMTDGEDHEPGALEAAREAAKDGIRVYTVGVGSAEGDLLRMTDPYGNAVFVRDETGNAVKSRLNEKLLREVADTGLGFYVNLQDPQAMRTVYERGIGKLARGEFAGGKVRQARERFQWPLAAGLLILALEMVLPEARRPRGAVQTGKATA